MSAVKPYKGPKKERRWIVEAQLETMSGELRKFQSRPLVSPDDTVAYLRDSGAKNITSHSRRYTRDELDEANRLAAMGSESGHIGEVE